MNNNQVPEEEINVIPSNNNDRQDTHQFDNEFLNTIGTNEQSTNTKKPLVAIPLMPNQTNDFNSGLQDDINSVIKPTENRFINDNFDTTASSLDDLNVSNPTGGPKVDYSKDPKVIENLQKQNTTTIGSEGKIFIIIIIVLLLFIFVLPTIFEAIRSIQYH